MLGKSKQEKEQEVKRSGRVRLTWLNCGPTVKEVRLLLAEAEKNKGSLCELPIRLSGVIYLLSCQSDHLSSEPCWTLYEGEDGSKQMWSYMNENVEMITDIVNMSLPQAGGGSSVDLSALAPAAPPPAEAVEEPKPVVPQVETMPGGSNDGIWGANSSMLGSTPWGAGNNAFADPGPSWAPPSQAPAPNQFPEMAPPVANWNQTGAGIDPQQTSGSQPAFSSQSPFQAGSRFQAGSPFSGGQEFPQQPPQNPYDPYNNAAPPGGQPIYTPPPPRPQLQPQPQPQPAAYSGPMVGSASVADFISYLDKNPHLTIAEVAFAPNLPSNSVDAAMRLQEMVCKGSFDERVAREAIKLAAKKGGMLDDSILSQAKTLASENPDELARKAASILQNAGLVTETDLAAVESKLQDGSTTYADALMAGGKVDKLLLDNAKKCHSMVSDGKIRADQAIIALHYCQRMRAKLDDALTDLSIDVL